MNGTDGNATGLGLVLVRGGSDDLLLLLFERLLLLLIVEEPESLLSILCGLGGIIVP